VVVTAEKGLANQNVRIVRVDSTAETRVTHYVTDDGTQLTLIDTRLSPLSTATAMRRAEASVLKNDSSEVDETIQSIRWSNSEKGRAYVLTGRLSREKLEEARKAIEATTR
jgi:hypothetical protein